MKWWKILGFIGIICLMTAFSSFVQKPSSTAVLTCVGIALLAANGFINARNNDKSRD
jgi:membrane-bound ClpP family serine protease